MSFFSIEIKVTNNLGTYPEGASTWRRMNNRRPTCGVLTALILAAENGLVFQLLLSANSHLGTALVAVFRTKTQ